MFSSKDGKMIILSSPSGAGKTTLVKKISKEKKFQNISFHTTRETKTKRDQWYRLFFYNPKKF